MARQLLGGCRGCICLPTSNSNTEKIQRTTPETRCQARNSSCLSLLAENFKPFLAEVVCLATCDSHAMWPCAAAHCAVGHRLTRRIAARAALQTHDLFTLKLRMVSSRFGGNLFSAKLPQTLLRCPITQPQKNVVMVLVSEYFPVHPHTTSRTECRARKQSVMASGQPSSSLVTEHG